MLGEKGWQKTEGKEEQLKYKTAASTKQEDSVERPVEGWRYSNILNRFKSISCVLSESANNVFLSRRMSDENQIKSIRVIILKQANQKPETRLPKTSIGAQDLPSGCRFQESGWQFAGRFLTSSRVRTASKNWRQE